MPPTRRMEDYIQTLCQKLIESEGKSEDFQTIASELQSALSKHIDGIRKGFKNYPLAQERRSIKD